jgi:hypothetical protein
MLLHYDKDIERLPKSMQTRWAPFQTDNVLYSLILANRLPEVLEHGVAPYDISPTFGEGFRAIVLTDASDPLHISTHLQNILQLKRDGYKLVRLHITTESVLYRSLSPGKAFQVLSLEPVSPDAIGFIEQL